MSRKRRTGSLPQPPWSFSPSEVAEWLASTGGGRRRESSSGRQSLVKGFLGSCPTAAKERLVGRLSGLGFERVKTDFLHLPPVLTRLVGSAEPEAFLGKLGDTQIHIRLRKGAALELRVTF